MRKGVLVVLLLLAAATLAAELMPLTCTPAASGSHLICTR